MTKIILKEIWEDDFLERISDIKVKVQGKEYKLHKMIFISSDYMKSTIIRGCENDIIEMVDIGQEVWEIIIRYLYSKILYTLLDKDKYRKFDLPNNTILSFVQGLYHPTQIFYIYHYLIMYIIFCYINILLLFPILLVQCLPFL